LVELLTIIVQSLLLILLILVDLLTIIVQSWLLVLLILVDLLTIIVQSWLLILLILVDLLSIIVQTDVSSCSIIDYHVKVLRHVPINAPGFHGLVRMSTLAFLIISRGQDKSKVKPK
jgi:hypothetical protein